VKTLLTRLLVAVVVGGFGLLAVMAPSMIRSASAQAVGALDHVTVTPASVSLAPGATQQYTATAFDASNNVIPGATFTWSATSGGSINASGLLTAGAVAGAYTNAVQVSAVFNSITKTGTASFTVVPGALDHVTVTPASVSLAPGATQQYTAAAYDASNNVIPGATFTWSATSGGSINASGLLTAGAVAGAYTNAVQASTTVNSVTKTGTASFTVVPGALDHVTVTPTSVSLAPGATQQYTAAAFDASNNVIPGATFTWSVSGGGSINASGLLTAGSVAGTYTNAVQASTTVNSVTKTGMASFTVTTAPPPSETPKPITIGVLRSLYNGLLHRFGFDHFLGVEAKVLDGQGNPMFLKAVAGKVTAVTQTSITIMLNGGTDVQTYTVSDKTQYIPAAQSGQKGLAGFQVNDKVTIGLVNGEVTLVAKVQPQVEKPRPVPAKERIEKEKDRIEKLREQINKRLDQLESRLDKLMGRMSLSNSNNGDNNDRISFSSSENGRGPQSVPPGLAKDKNKDKHGRGHDKD